VTEQVFLATSEAVVSSNEVKSSRVREGLSRERWIGLIGAWDGGLGGLFEKALRVGARSVDFAGGEDGSDESRVLHRECDDGLLVASSSDQGLCSGSQPICAF